MKKTKIIFVLLVLITILFININQVYAADGVFSQGQQFINQGAKNASVNTSQLDDSISFLYNTLLGIGTVLAVLVGMVLGIKYMTGSLEEKADLKQALVGYVVSCVVIFGAFGIWKIVINILSGI